MRLIVLLIGEFTAAAFHCDRDETGCDARRD